MKNTYTGPSVSVAAHLAASAHGGQVFYSNPNLATLNS